MMRLVDDVLGEIGLPHWETYRLWLREALWESRKGACGICGEALALIQVHVDHIEPRSGGGSDAWENLQPVHNVCNARKGGVRKRLAYRVRASDKDLTPSPEAPRYPQHKARRRRMATA